MLDDGRQIKMQEGLCDLYYEVMEKQIKPFPHNSLFHKVSEKDIEDYWFPIVQKIEQLCKIAFDKEIKLRYANSVYAMQPRAEFIKNFKKRGN